MKELPTRYDHKEVEARIYKQWEDSGYFNPDKCVEEGLVDEKKEVFSIVLPPPNVTGILHMGHTAMLAIEDILTRYARMQGRRTLWLPGTDHAAIATQSKVESQIYKKEKKNRHDLGREEFLRRVDEFATESHDNIVSQMKHIGASVDWSREAFTLDDDRNKAVRFAFKKMYDDGLIYRDFRIVNWDPKGQTTISDDEVVHEEAKGTLYTFRYSKDFPIPIATTRPETKVGDTAVAVHPEDDRYKEFIGKEFEVKFADVDLKIKIVGDKDIDKDFGTGAVGVTPSHSMIDWEMAERHDLEKIQVINEYAKMTNEAGPMMAGKKTKEAREIVVEWLKSEGLLEKEEEINMNISKAERTGGVVEPLPKLQWFIDVNKKFALPHSKISDVKDSDEVSLKELMQKAVHGGDTKIIPERFEKIYFHWIDNLRPWCISRQIWYGHRIPVWYKGDEIYCGVEAPEGDGWEQDPDTLDTWFSSGLWTFSTLGWPEKTEDLEMYHPTTVLETGYDILFFWVARMILMSTYFMGEVPFKTVYLHGLVRDEKGRKMSKSLGNFIDPLDMTEKFTADATRMSLIVGNGAGNDLKLSENKVKGYRNFTTKIWNAARFVLMNLPDGRIPEGVTLGTDDQKLVDEARAMKREIGEHIENFELHLGAEKAYHFLWHTFADKVIEGAKPRLQGDDEEEKLAALTMTLRVLEECLVMLHPFVPFVTEEVYGKIYPGKLLMVRSWE